MTLGLGDTITLGAQKLQAKNGKVFYIQDEADEVHHQKSSLTL